MVVKVLFFVVAFIWLMFLIGYPIYKKVIKREIFDWIWYAMWLNGLALIINIINLIYKCCY